MNEHRCSQRFRRRIAHKHIGRRSRHDLRRTQREWTSRWNSISSDWMKLRRERREENKRLQHRHTIQSFQQSRVDEHWRVNSFHFFLLLLLLLLRIKTKSRNGFQLKKSFLSWTFHARVNWEILRKTSFVWTRNDVDHWDSLVNVNWRSNSHLMINQQSFSLQILSVDREKKQIFNSEDAQDTFKNKDRIPKGHSSWLILDDWRRRRTDLKDMCHHCWCFSLNFVEQQQTENIQSESSARVDRSKWETPTERSTDKTSFKSNRFIRSSVRNLSNSFSSFSSWSSIGGKTFVSLSQIGRSKERTAVLWGCEDEGSLHAVHCGGLFDWVQFLPRDVRRGGARGALAPPLERWWEKFSKLTLHKVTIRINSSRYGCSVCAVPIDLLRHLSW